MLLKLFESLLLLAISIVGFVRAMSDLRFETFTKVEGDKETLLEFNVRLIGRHRLLNGTLVTHVDLDNTYDVSIRVEGFVNGEWKQSNIASRLKTCTFMETIYARFFESSLMDTNFPRAKDACPLKKGEYYIKNVAIHTVDWVTYIRRGLNKIELLILKGNQIYGGFIATGSLLDEST